MRCVISNLQFDFLLVCWCRLTLRLLLSFSAKFSLFEKIFGKTRVLRQLKALQLNVTFFFPGSSFSIKHLLAPTCRLSGLN